MDSAWNSQIPSFVIETALGQYRVGEGRAFFANSLKMFQTDVQPFCINIDSMWDENICPTQEYYVRLIQPIQKENWIHNICTYPWQDGNHWSLGLIEVELEKGKVHCYPVLFDNEYYLVTESLFPVTVERMQEMTFGIAAAIGIITCRINLDEYYIALSDNPDYTSILGLCYQGLRPSIYGQYSIFTTNLYSLELALKHQPKAAYAMADLMDCDGKDIDSGKVDWLHMDFVSRLARSISENASLTRATSTIIEATTQPLEYQAALMCVALETITTVLNGKQPEVIPVAKQMYDETVAPRLLKVIDEYHNKGIIAEEGKRILTKRITHNLNGQANASKLTDAFVKLGYNVSSVESDCINKRNPIFHGREVGAKNGYKVQADYLHHLCLVLHKLCCILLLKQAGFDSYIINNAVLYGFDKECQDKESVLVKI